jgi:hypothetical protein
MRYSVVVPYAWKPYFDEFEATLKIPRENCLFIDDTNPVGGIGIMKAHNMGIDFMRAQNTNWLIVMSAGIRFGEKGGLDFLNIIEEHSNLHVINGAGKVTFDGEQEQTIAMGYHLTAFNRDVIEAIGRWDENFTPYGFDDIDMMLRMKKYFGNQLRADTFPVDMRHVSRSHSIQLAGVEAPSEPRIAYFTEKWGRHPGAWQWDGWPYPFNNEQSNLKYWPPAANGGKWND